VDSDSSVEWEWDPCEVDDAPDTENVPTDYHDDEDEGVYEEDRDLRAPVSSWTPWVRLSIFVRDGQLGYTTSVPATDGLATEVSLHHLGQGWATTAQTLIGAQGNALRCATPLAALHALGPYAMEDLERSAGQGSRDRRVVVDTPFGLAPLWFFAQGRSDGLFQDLETLGRAVMARQPTRLTPAVIEEIIHNPSIKADSIRRVHAKALLALAHQPEVLARHRSLWPLTTIDALFDDLGVEATGKAHLGRSGDVAVLALVGAFDPPNLLLASVARHTPRREPSP